jgi:glycosyltransferase involved in cell wall biosynthesis
MQISAVIPVYNGAPYVAAAIDSALAQRDVEMEVVVVDDGSSDATPAVLATFGDRIRIIRQENRGLPAARNAGIAAARGELVAFLDADDTWEPDKSRKQLAFLAARPRCGMVFCDVYEIDASGRRGGVFLGDAARNLPTARCLERLLLGNFVLVPGVVVRRAVFDQVGGFDETLGSVEDYDMWLRIAAAHEIGVIPEALASYRVWPGQMSKHRDRMLDSEVRVLEAALGRHPDVALELRRPLRRRFARLYDEAGYRDLQEGQLAAALRKFLRAARHDPLWYQPYRHALATGMAAAGLWRPSPTG